MSAERSDKVRLGGMALRNGILVHSYDHWAAAVRTPEGEVKLASGAQAAAAGGADGHAGAARGCPAG